MTDTSTDTSRIRRFLRSERGQRFFCDGPPEWTQRRSGRPSKRAKEARLERRLLILSLRRDGKPKALALALRLERCKRRRCLSGACPVCGRALQRLFVHACRNFFESFDRDMMAINIVSAKRRIDCGNLDRHDLFEGIERRLRRALDALRVPAVGGFDISANEHEADDFEPHWMPHAWIIAPGRRARRVEQKLRSWFPSTETVPRPVQMKQFDGAAAGFAYALKPDFDRRVSLELRTQPDGSRSTHSTRKKPIWGKQRAELALALDKAGLASRLFLRGFELIITQYDVEIVPVALTGRGPELASDVMRNRRELVP